MRRSPLIGNKLWFGPRSLGWGWSPVAWEGWLFVLIGIGATIASGLLSEPWRAAGIATSLTTLIVVCVLKGTRPGGPSAWEEFARSTDHGPLAHGGGDDTPDLHGITRNFEQRQIRRNTP